MFELRDRLYVRAGEGGAGGGAGAGAGEGAGTGTGTPAFDPAAFKTEILTALSGEINKAVNGMAKGLKTDFAKLLKPGGEGEGAGTGAGAGEGAGAGTGEGAGAGTGAAGEIKDPALNAVVQGLRRQVEALNKKANDAEKREQQATSARLENERTTAIRSVLNDIPFRTEAHRNLFFKATSTDIERDEDGSLIAKSESGPLPIKDYLKTLAERDYPDMLQPKGSGGAGAAAGNGERRGGSGPVKMSELTPEKINALTPAELAAQLKEIMAGNLVG